jgi:hypothetical protein
MFRRMHLPGLFLATAAGVAMANPAPPPLPVQCSASGAKLVAAMTEAAVCQRFVAAFAAASGRPAVASSTAPEGVQTGLVVALRFLPQGVATASATMVRAGSAAPQQRFELAVSDRGFVAADIDRLAADTARGLAKP